MIYKYSAAWCSPCKTLTNTLKRLEIEVTDVDIDQEPELVAQYNIRSVPTLVYIEDGFEVGRLIGDKHERDIKNWLSDCETQISLAKDLVAAV